MSNQQQPFSLLTPPQLSLVFAVWLPPRLVCRNSMPSTLQGSRRVHPFSDEANFIKLCAKVLSHLAHAAVVHGAAVYIDRSLKQLQRRR